MKFSSYQERAMETKQDPDGIPTVALWALGLGGESGEVLEKVKKVFRDKEGDFSSGDINLIKYELGDALWYITAIADALGVSLQEVAVSNLAKLRDRCERGVLGGEGDKR